MTDQNNLPVKASAKNVAAPVEKRGSLVARGLAAVKNNVERVQHQDNDARYRQARIQYDRVTTGWWWDARGSEQIVALEIFQQLADLGYGKAYYPLSTFFSGELLLSVQQNQILAERFRKQAFDWCFARQLQDDAEIWNDLGASYCVGGWQNDDLAFFWYRKAAEQGYVPAQLSVAQLYSYGQGVAQDYEQAAYWYREAAEQGCLVAQIELGAYYEYGRGVDQSDEQSAYWYRKAAEQCVDDETLGIMEAGRQGVKDRIEAEQGEENTATDGKYLAKQKAKESCENEQKFEPQQPENLKKRRYRMTPEMSRAFKIVEDAEALVRQKQQQKATKDKAKRKTSPGQ